MSAGKLLAITFARSPQLSCPALDKLFILPIKSVIHYLRVACLRGHSIISISNLVVEVACFFLVKKKIQRLAISEPTREDLRLPISLAILYSLYGSELSHLLWLIIQDD